MNDMTMKERVLAVIRGQEHDRVPFIQLSDIAAPNEEIWRLIGRENMGLLAYPCLYRFVTPNCSFDERKFRRGGLAGVRTILRTPKGEMMNERLIEPALGSSSIVRHYVQCVDDYAKLLAYLRDIHVEMHLDDFRRTEREFGDQGVLLPGVSFPTPYQGLWIWWVGLENLCLHMVDHPDVIDEVVVEFGRVLDVLFDLFCLAADEVDFAYINFGDNITAPVIGERYFRKYCIPYYNRLAEKFDEAGLDVLVAVHTDGEIKPLWSAIGESRIGLLDSFTPRPDTQTSVAEAVAMWPRMRLGVNFPSSVHLGDEAGIYNAAMEILEQGARTGRLIIQISENVPPGVWKKSFPQIVKAIRDFGPVSD